MRGGALPPALLCMALGLALSFAPRRALLPALAACAALAAPCAFIPVPAPWLDGVFLGCWASVILASASVHLPKGLGPKGAVILSGNTGLWTGIVIAGSGHAPDLLKSLPLTLLCVPGAWLVARRWGLALKVATSWLIAIAILCAALPLVPTPGYMPDHMD